MRTKLIVQKMSQTGDDSMLATVGRNGASFSPDTRHSHCSQHAMNDGGDGGETVSSQMDTSSDQS